MVKHLKKPFKLGSIELPSNIFCAPLAGCSDLPFRKMTAKYRPGLIYCEMVKMDALIRNDPQTFRMLDYVPDMHPIGGQLCGSKPKLAGPCAKIIEELGFDVVDLNCGCPVDKVTKDGSGSALLKEPERIGEIISNMVAAVRIPVTIKIRIGWDFNSIIAPKIVKIAEAAGASAICIHGRTRSQGYKGPANWDHIRACKEAATTIAVIANGDVFDALSAEKIFDHTGCDAILLARGTMGQPWLVEDIYAHLEGLPPIQRTGLDVQATLLEHLKYITAYQSERRALLDLRRVGCWFLKGGKDMKALREALNRSTTMDEVRGLICAYPWEDLVLTPAQVEETCEAEC